MNGFYAYEHNDIFCTGSTQLAELAYWVLDLGRIVKINKIVFISIPGKSLGNLLTDIDIRLGVSSNFADNAIITSNKEILETYTPIILTADSSVEGNIFSVESQTDKVLCFGEIQIILN